MAKKSKKAVSNKPGHSAWLCSRRSSVLSTVNRRSLHHHTFSVSPPSCISRRYARNVFPSRRLAKCLLRWNAYLVMGSWTDCYSICQDEVPRCVISTSYPLSPRYLSYPRNIIQHCVHILTRQRQMLRFHSTLLIVSGTTLCLSAEILKYYKTVLINRPVLISCVKNSNLSTR